MQHTTIEKTAFLLYEELKENYEEYIASPNHQTTPFHMPNSFTIDFFKLIDHVILGLMENDDNFFGFFSFQMKKSLRFDIASPTAVNFKSAAYVLYFNPFLYLPLTEDQMKDAIKHDIFHIVSLHLIRAKDVKNMYSKLAINMAMDVIANMYIKHVPPNAITLQWLNTQLGLFLPPFETFEYYVEKIQSALDNQTEMPSYEGDIENAPLQLQFNPEKTHDIWEESDTLDSSTLQKFTEKYIKAALKGNPPSYLTNILNKLEQEASSLPWSFYVKKFVGSIAAERKKTTTRLDRRQPHRLDLRGKLRHHTARLLIALDISGSISDEEFKQALVEIIEILKNFKHKITIIECDDNIRCVYPLQTIKDVQERPEARGGTLFSPVFSYANQHNIDVLIYFTDGKGEKTLSVTPQRYKVLWVFTGASLSVTPTHGIVKHLAPQKKQDPDLMFYNVERGGYSMNNQEKMLL